MMEQVLVTKKKILSFEDICPQWSKYLAETQQFNFNSSAAFIGDDQKLYDLVQPKCCIVGEAHREDDYSSELDDAYCKKCDKFSYDVFDVRGSRSFEKFKEKFIAHFNQKHTETFIGTRTSG